MMLLDHVVLWTEDVSASMDFYTRVIGLAPVRFEEFARGDAPFPSVRVSQDSILDLMPIRRAPGTEAMTQVAGSAGHRVNHVCLAMTKSEYYALDQRLQAEGINTSARLSPTYGARGWGPEGLDFPDPDGNVVEARHYDDQSGCGSSPTTHRRSCWTALHSRRQLAASHLRRCARSVCRDDSRDTHSSSAVSTSRPTARRPARRGNAP